MYLIASLPIGINLSLLPLPTTLINSTSKKRLEILRFINSETLKPQLYKVSSMALFLVPSGVLKSSELITAFISSMLKVSGNLRLNLGPSKSSVGS